MSTVCPPHRMNVIFADSTYQALNDAALRRGKSKAEVLRDGISLMRYIDDIRAQGGRILVERGVTLHEIIIP